MLRPASRNPAILMIERNIRIPRLNSCERGGSPEIRWIDFCQVHLETREIARQSRRSHYTRRSRGLCSNIATSLPSDLSSTLAGVFAQVSARVFSILLPIRIRRSMIARIARAARTRRDRNDFGRYSRTVSSYLAYLRVPCGFRQKVAS